MLVKRCIGHIICLFILLTPLVTQAASTRSNAVPVQSYSKVSFYKLNTYFDGLYNKKAAFMVVRAGNDGDLTRSLNPFINAQLRKRNFPFVMVVERTRGVDLATGKPAVYSKLVTIVTDHMARSSGPIYATPLTTLAYELTQLSTPKRSARGAVVDRFEDMSSLVGETFSFGISPNVDIALDPAAHNETVVTAREKRTVLEHRAMIESFTAVLQKMSRNVSAAQLRNFYVAALRKMGRPAAVSGDDTIDLFVKLLALDYVADNAFNGKVGNENIPRLNLKLFSVAPRTLLIANAGSTRVSNVLSIVKREAAQQRLNTSYPSVRLSLGYQAFPTQTATRTVSNVAPANAPTVLTKSLAPTTTAPVTKAISGIKPLSHGIKQFNPGHYALMWPRADISRQARANGLLDDGIFTGAQGRYMWRELEPSEGKYDFSRIERDLAYLASIGKKLVVQLEAREWGGTAFGFPNYIATPKYNGGFFRRKSGVAIPKLYNPLVSDRFRALIRALGQRIDKHPALEAVVTGETSLGLRDPQNPAAVKDYRAGAWRDQIKLTATASRQSFPTTNIIMYVNYLDYGASLISDVVKHAVSINVGIGGPDLTPHHPVALRDHYKYYPQVAGKIPLGVAVQWNNYNYTNPATGRRVTIKEIVDYGVKNLHLNYFFWVVRKPQFYEQVMPTLKSMNMPINR